MHQDVFYLSGFPLLTLKYHPLTLVNQTTFKNAENCWQSNLFCPFSVLVKVGAVEV